LVAPDELSLQAESRPIVLDGGNHKNISYARYASRSSFLRGGLSCADWMARTEPPEMLRALPACGEVCCLNTLWIQAWMEIRQCVSLTELPCPGSRKS